jgi:transcriptional regulator with XRE-family HTH domain
MNERLRSAMLRAQIDGRSLAAKVGVDTKTVDRWVSGRVPHRANRIAIAAVLNEDDAHLWPSTRPDQAPGGASSGEVLAAYGHRADVPQDVWASLLHGATEQIDLLGYAYPFVFELTPRLPALIEQKCATGARVRIAVADPDCDHVKERDNLEQLGGTLPGRIRTAMNLFRDLRDIDGVQIGQHRVHLYNSMFRFDQQMVVTPHLFRWRGYQHPALHLRKLSPYGIFESFAEQFEQVWDTVQSVEDSKP